MINIRGLDKAEILAALYNGSKQQGSGLLQPAGRTSDMTREHAAKLIRATAFLMASGTRQLCFDYFHGRAVRVNLTSDTELDPTLYDHDNGEGAAARIIQSLRDTQNN